MKIFNNLIQHGHEQVIFCQDSAVGLKAIIAIHDSTLGPSLGGCRFWDYAKDEEALLDVLRLSRGMTYKAALANLPLGGGKSVIIGKHSKLKSRQFFHSFGNFINSLNGRYITAEDVNMLVQDIDWIAEKTEYVTGASRHGSSGDPSPITALGVYSGIRAALKFLSGSDSVSGKKIAIQGCGAVGSHLAKLLHTAGGELLVSDIDQNKIKNLGKKVKVTAVVNEEIHRQNVDIFAPCALGGILNAATISEIKAPIIAGGANNQLLHEASDIKAIQKQQTIYIPDYAINAGGLINVYHELMGYRAEAAKADAEKIYDTVLKILNKSVQNKCSTLEASNILAESKLKTEKSKNRPPQSQNFHNQKWIKRANLLT